MDAIAAAPNTVIALFPDHLAAEAAVKKLNEGGLDMKALSLIGKGYHTDEQVVGFYNISERVEFWGKRGAFWGGLWGMFVGGAFLAVPVVGHVVLLGYLATMVIATVEGAALVGGLSVLGAALFSIGIPKDSVIEYETELKADGFLVMAHGTAEEIAHAKAILAETYPTRMDVHVNAAAVVKADQMETAF